MSNEGLAVQEDGLKKEHTSTPWFVINHVTGGGWTIQNREGGGGDCVAMRYADSSQANAAFIVKAVNCHDELVQALRVAVSIIGHPDDVVTKSLVEILEKAR